MVQIDNETHLVVPGATDENDSKRVVLGRRDVIKGIGACLSTLALGANPRPAIAVQGADSAR